MTFRSTHFILNIFFYGEYLRKYNEIVSDSTVRYVHCDELYQQYVAVFNKPQVCKTANNAFGKFVYPTAGVTLASLCLA